MTSSVLGIETNQVKEIDPRTGKEKVFYLPKNNPQTGKEERVRLPQSSRRQGTYIIGATGTGKSALILNLVMQDIKQGKGVAVLDPHSDLINSILARLDEDDIDRVVLLDPLDQTHAFGLNLYSCADPTNDVLVQGTYEQVEHIFDVLWFDEGEDQFGPQVREGLLHSSYALIYNSHTEYTGSGMLEIPLLFLEDTPRMNMVKQIQDPVMRSYWEKRYEPFDRNEKARRADMVINKLNEFIANPIFRRIVGQGRSTIDFSDVMDTGKILLVKLPGRFERMAQILGAMVIAQLLGASYEREKQHKRPQFNIYADEFQRFSTRDFAKLLTEASRKYNTPVTIAHQARDFIDLKNKAASLQVPNLIVLRIIRKDADEIAGNFDCTQLRTKKVLKQRTKPVFKEWDEQVWVEEGEARYKETEAQYEVRHNELTQCLSAAEKREHEALARRDGAHEAHTILKLAFTGEHYGFSWPHDQFDYPKMDFENLLYWEEQGLVSLVKSEAEWREIVKKGPHPSYFDPESKLAMVRERRQHLHSAYPAHIYLPFHPAWYCHTWGGDRWATSRSFWTQQWASCVNKKGNGWTDEKIENTIQGLVEVKSQSVSGSFEYSYTANIFGYKATQRVDYTSEEREERYAVSETTSTGLHVVLQEQLTAASAEAKRILSDLCDELSEIIKPIFRQGVWFKPELKPSPRTGFVYPEIDFHIDTKKMRSKEAIETMTGWPLLAKLPQPKIGEKRTVKGWVRHGNWYIQEFSHLLSLLRTWEKALQALCQQREDELHTCQEHVSSIKQQLNELKAKDQEIKREIMAQYQKTEHHKAYLGEQPEVEERTRISHSYSEGSSETVSSSRMGTSHGHGTSSSKSTSYSTDEVQWYELVDELDQTPAERRDEIAGEIAMLPDYVARVKIKDENDELVEYTIRTLALERGLPEKALKERIAQIKAAMIGQNIIRPKHVIDEEIRKRQQALRRPPLEPSHKQGMLPPPEDEPPITRRG